MQSAKAHASLSAGARNAGRLGLFGGSFDPPHGGHLYVAQKARMHFGLDHVIFVPAARPPHKLERKLASGDQRCRMLELLLQGHGAFSIWSTELAREGPSYTLDTVCALQEELPSACELFLILGADNLEGFASWRGIEELLQRADPLVCVRAGWDPEPQSLAALSAEARAKLARGRLEVEPFEASSSEIRSALAGEGAAREEAGALPRAASPSVNRNEENRNAGELLPGNLLEYLRSQDIY